MNLSIIIHESRSGSTYLANLLSTNYNIIIPPEENCIAAVLNSIKTKSPWMNRKLWVRHILKDKKMEDWNIDIRSFIKINEVFVSKKSLIFSLLKEYERNNCTIYGNRNFAIKKGVYILFYEKLLKLIPDIKFVILVRDGRGVYNSKKRTLHSIKKKVLSKGLYYEAKKWAENIRMYYELMEKYPSKAFLIKYEDLLLRPERIQNVAEFLNLKEDAISYYSIPEKYEHMHKNVKKDPIPDFIDKWRNELTEEEIKSYQNLTKRELEKLNYTIV